MKKDTGSEPFLLTGFEKKMLHISTDKAAEFDVEIDFMGNCTWHRYEQIKVGAEGYAKHVFPDAFSAQWVWLTPLADCRATPISYFV